MDSIYYDKVYSIKCLMRLTSSLVPVRHHGTVQNSWPRGNGSLSIWQGTHDPGQENAVSPDEVQKGQYYLDDI